MTRPSVAVSVVLDTNAWRSAAVVAGLCAERLLELDAGGHALLTSALASKEAHAVMRWQFLRHGTAIERLDALWARAARVPDVTEPADDAHARLVVAAQAAGAQVFITGDQRGAGLGSAWQPAYPFAASGMGAGGLAPPLSCTIAYVAAATGCR